MNVACTCKSHSGEDSSSASTSILRFLPEYESVGKSPCHTWHSGLKLPTIPCYRYAESSPADNRNASGYASRSLPSEDGELYPSAFLQMKLQSLAELPLKFSDSHWKIGKYRYAGQKAGSVTLPPSCSLPQ